MFQRKRRKKEKNWKHKFKVVIFFILIRLLSCRFRVQYCNEFYSISSREREHYAISVSRSIFEEIGSCLSNHEFTCIHSLNHIQTQLHRDHTITVESTAVLYETKMPLVNFNITGAYWDQFQWFNWCVECSYVCVYATMLPHICSEKTNSAQSAYATTFSFVLYSSNDRGESNKKNITLSFLRRLHISNQQLPCFNKGAKPRQIYT